MAKTAKKTSLEDLLGEPLAPESEVLQAHSRDEILAAADIDTLRQIVANQQAIINDLIVRVHGREGRPSTPESMASASQKIDEMFSSMEKGTRPNQYLITEPLVARRYNTNGQAENFEFNSLNVKIWAESEEDALDRLNVDWSREGGEFPYRAELIAGRDFVAEKPEAIEVS